jgi:7-cyano-7-deazaguanine synthase
LLSGGLDSATTLAIARAEGYAAHALTFRYGQRHAIEVAAAQAVARQLGAVRHVLLDLDLRIVGGSALTADLPVPKDRSDRDLGSGVPITYVPARNTVFLAHALGLAEVCGADALFIGVNAVDYSGYPDCRPEFIRGFEALANLATRASVEGGRRFRVEAPLLALTKAAIVRRAVALGVDLSLTRSCYDPDPSGRACGRCDACRLRLRGFREAGLDDPAPYVERPPAAAPG